MRLTPFGKLLLFLIGLGLILTALHRFVPREQQVWRKWIAGAAPVGPTRAAVPRCDDPDGPGERQRPRARSPTSRSPPSPG